MRFVARMRDVTSGHPRRPALSVIIPVYNGTSTLTECLRAVFDSRFRDFEVIVVDDASTDGSAGAGRSFPCTVFSLQFNAGPGPARNAGAARSTGELLFFLDADVIIGPDTLGDIVREMAARADQDAMFGSYAKHTPAPGFITAYKNLLHHFTHQTSLETASTFCGGFGAVRRDVFFSAGGFDARWRYLEDIELGYRLNSAGYRIRLSKPLQMIHLKRYTLAALIRSDIFGRAVPWTRLMLERRIYRNDLNTRTANLLSVPVAFLLLAIPGLVVDSDLWPASCALAAAFLLLNRQFLGFLRRERGLAFALASLPLCWLGYIAGGLGAMAGAVMHIRDGFPRSSWVARREPRDELG